VRSSALVLFLSCAPPVVPATNDAGMEGDAGTLDAGRFDAGEPDAGLVDAGAERDGGLVAPCTQLGELLSCAHQTIRLSVARPIPMERVVHVGLPVGAPPARGWPVAFLFQGSLFSAQLTWSARPTDPFGAVAQTNTVKQLLEAGFAVVTPEVRLFGSTYWDTNVPQWALFWDQAPDHHLMLALLDAVGAGTFGPLDATRLYAGGISSGGYMTSRMALSYPGKFKALAIHSASWATCSGPICVLPASLPADHPPTLFVHGERDLVVPIGTMRPYDEALRNQGTASVVVTSASGGHEWLEVANPAIRDFFLAHP